MIASLASLTDVEFGMFGCFAAIHVEGKEKRRVKGVIMIAVLKQESVIRGTLPDDDDDVPSFLCVCG